MKKFLICINLFIGLFFLTTGNSIAFEVSASMFSNSNIFDDPTKCVPPYNINYVVTPDKKQVTFAWEEYPTSFPILNYQINDSANIPIWIGNSRKQHCFTYKDLPGTSGKFIFYFYSNCTTGLSLPTKFEVVT